MNHIRSVIAIVCLAWLGSASMLAAAEEWESATSLPGLDFTGLSETGKAAVLKVLREQGCNCGCEMKLAECRIKDPACTYSRKLSDLVITETKAGKSAAEVHADLYALLAKSAPVQRKLLDDPVTIPIAGDPIRGALRGKVEIIEFSDFQCPYCAQAAPKIDALLALFPDDLRLVFKQFPLDSHPQARMAAQAALAAHAQGKFWPMHDRLFAGTRELSRTKILAMAAASGLDMKRFTADLESGKYAVDVEREVKQGGVANVEGTPTLFIDGKRYNGAFEITALQQVIATELASRAR